MESNYVCHLKRATVSIIDIRKPKSDKDTVRAITRWQEDLSRLPSTVNRKKDDSYLMITKEIRRLRKALKAPRPQVYMFRVDVLKYKKQTEVEWTFNPQTETFKKMLSEVVNQAIRQVRDRLKEEPFPQKFAPGYTAYFHGKKKNGRVFQKSGEVLRMYIDKNLKNLYTDKVPLEPRKYIGIELEFCAPIKEELFAIKLFRSGIHKFAQLKQDGSLRPHEDKHEHGYELAILLEESNYKKRLKQITTLLSEVKAVAIDRRAGLHVHLDMRRRDKDLVYSNLVACQYALLSVVDPKRYNNEFCRVVDSRKFPTEFTGQREERYKTINAAAFYKYKTLEVRMHEGSVDYAQITNWVDLLIKITNYPKKLKNNIAKISALNKRIKLDKKLYNYVQDRSCFWQVRNEEETRDMRSNQQAIEELDRLRRTLNVDRIAPLIGTDPIQPFMSPPQVGEDVEESWRVAPYRPSTQPPRPSRPERTNVWGTTSTSDTTSGWYSTTTVSNPLTIADVQDSINSGAAIQLRDAFTEPDDN